MIRPYAVARTPLSSVPGYPFDHAFLRILFRGPPVSEGLLTNNLLV